MAASKQPKHHTESQEHTPKSKKASAKITNHWPKAFLFVFIIALIGAYLLVGTHAAGTASFSLSPPSGNYKAGQTFTVTVSENSGTDQVNAVQMNLSYNAAQMQFNSVTSGSSASSPFTLCAQSSGGSGVVNVACASPNNTTPFVTGTQTVATISFTMLATSGSTNISIAAGSEIALYSNQTDDWNGTLTSATYTVVQPPTVSLSAPAAGYVHVNSNITANAADLSGTGLSKVQFYENGTLLNTDTSSPYSYTWNTLSVADGTYTLTAQALDNDADTTTSSPVSVTVNNGDANNDGVVNVTDLSILASNWGKTGQTYAQADFTGDGTVNISDLSILAKNYGW